MNRITITLTDEQVEDLRTIKSGDDWSWAGEIAMKVLAALPPEPVRVEIELPPGFAAPWLYESVYHSQADFYLSKHEADALNAVKTALKEMKG